MLQQVMVPSQPWFLWPLRIQALQGLLRILMLFPNWQTCVVSTCLLVLRACQKSFFIFIFLVQLAIAKRELDQAKVVVAVGAGLIPTKDLRIKRPAKIGNLQYAMGLEHNRTRYLHFRVSFFFLGKYTITEA